MVTMRIEGVLRGTWELELAGVICADRTGREEAPTASRPTGGTRPRRPGLIGAVRRSHVTESRSAGDNSVLRR